MTARDILVIGAGQRGAEWCAAVDAHPSWRLAGVVDLDGAALARVGAGRSGMVLDADLGAVLDRTSPAAAIVATPHHHHVGPVDAALAAGLGVLVEKPFTTSLESAQALTARAEAAGLPLLVAQNYRHLRWVRAAKAIVDAGRLGTIQSVSMRYRRPWEDLDEGRRRAEHSVVWELAPHHVDLLRLLLGDEIAEVRASLSSRDSSRPAGATMTSTGRTAGGVALRYDSTYEEGGRVARIEGGRRFTMSIRGVDATLHVLLRWLVLVPKRGVPSVVRRGPRLVTEEAVLLDELAKAADGDASASNARDNLRTLAGVIAILTSAAQAGAPVSPLDLLDA